MTARADLYAVLDRYLDALRARDFARLDWGPGVFNTENNVRLEPGDGVWNTATAVGPYDLRFADEATSQVAVFTTIEETNAVSPACIRIGVQDGAIAEVETVVARNADEGFPFLGQKFERKPVMETPVPAGENSPRAELIEIANGYFETLEQNDGVVRTRFFPDCNRVENGVQTTNNPDFPLPIARMGCVEQFSTGWYRYDDRLRARRFPLVDEERGIVLAYGFIDHCGIVGEYTLTDGTPASSPVRRPHSYYLAEAFKIRTGAIEQIEANFLTVPYHMPSPWDGRSEPLT